MLVLAKHSLHCSQTGLHNSYSIDDRDNVLGPWFRDVCSDITSATILRLKILSELLLICFPYIFCRGTVQDLFNAMGAMYAACLFLGVQNGSSVQPVVAVERTVFYRERAAGMYSALPYAIAQVNSCFVLIRVYLQTISFLKNVLRFDDFCVCRFW